MLSRRHLRIKVLQALYSYFSEGFENVNKGERELHLSINRFYELFLYQIAFISEVHQVSQKLIDDAKQKLLPTEEDKNPNIRFAENKILTAVSSNSYLNKLIEEYKISWVGENEIARRAFAAFKNTPDYSKYMNAESNNFEKDKRVVASLIQEVLADFPPLMQIYEERSIFWVDDIDMVNLILMNVVKSCKENKIDDIFNNLEFNIDDEDREFATELFRQTILHSSEYEKFISDKTHNWEVERIAIMDILIMKMAIAELLQFSSIPVKVTLNEYIELAKLYSTPKSNVFVNGILDKLIEDFRSKEMIKKTGRGLM
ncbi:MAG TPA: transcription antitermination factor NusB [Bacteroidales bacterium]|nr:transcription antitermination factor NusB [Bacteroidales bacterium]HPS17377.1 transcription antitermination factor NusB [Bacteroidales bacterium]